MEFAEGGFAGCLFLVYKTCREFYADGVCWGPVLEDYNCRGWAGGVLDDGCDCDYTVLVM